MSFKTEKIVANVPTELVLLQELTCDHCGCKIKEARDVDVISAWHYGWGNDSSGTLEQVFSDSMRCTKKLVDRYLSDVEDEYTVQVNRLPYVKGMLLKEFLPKVKIF